MPTQTRNLSTTQPSVAHAMLQNCGHNALHAATATTSAHKTFPTTLWRHALPNVKHIPRVVTRAMTCKLQLERLPQCHDGNNILKQCTPKRVSCPKSLWSTPFPHFYHNVTHGAVMEATAPPKPFPQSCGATPIQTRNMSKLAVARAMKQKLVL